MPFQKGQSGNPGGRPKLQPEFRELCKAERDKNAALLIELRDNVDCPPAVRLQAAVKMIEYDCGKPLQTLDVHNFTASESETLILKAQELSQRIAGVHVQTNADGIPKTN